MTEDEFVRVTAGRLPTAAELMAVADGIGLEFGTNGDGRPVVRFKARDRALGAMLARLLRREPWRTQVIEARGLASRPIAETHREWREGQDRPQECRWRGGHVFRHLFPEDGYPVGAGWWRYEGDQEWQPIPGRDVERGEAEPGPYPQELRDRVSSHFSRDPSRGDG